MKSIITRLETLETEAAKLAAKKNDRPSLDVSKLSIEALREIMQVQDEYGAVEMINLSTKTILELREAYEQTYFLSIAAL